MRLHIFTAPLAVGLCAALVAVAPAADFVSDVVLARSALAAIDADPQLREVNLIVSVVDRVAVIGGPVSSADVSKRAETVVRGVSGIADVKNRCFVQDKPDPLLRAVADRLGVSRPPLLAELPGVVSPPRPATTSEARPPDNAYAALTPPAPVGTEVVVRRPANLSVEPAGGFLGVPEAFPSGRLSATLTAIGTPPAPTGTVFPARPTDVLASAEAIRNADARFTALAVEMRSGTLVIGGKAPRAADAWDFAQALRRVPGVARVVVGAVAPK